MKKHLLFGSALLAAISAYPQNGQRPQNEGVENYAARIAKRFSMEAQAAENADKTSGNNTAPVATEQENADNQRPSNTGSFVTSWNGFTGSMNILGSLVTNSAPLNFNEDLNAVTFVHRKSQTYLVTPPPLAAAASGAIVSMVSQNWGASWDSTCFYSNDLNWGRYPQGGVYNQAGNTCIDQAYIVGTGPVTPSSAGWIGNFYASKQLGAANYNATPSATPNAQQVMLNANLGVNKVDYSRYDLSMTDDGKIRTAGMIANNINSTDPIVFGFRGTRLMTATFNAGVFTWVPDSIIPQAVIAANGTKEISSVPHMAWNESGTVGYIFHIGVAPTATNNNRGYQPIIYKTVNSGASWSAVNGIDFNGNGMNAVLDHILSTRVSTAVTIPLFDEGEGVAAVVDKNDKLHIVSLVKASISQHPDSLGFTYLFNNADGETYGYAHLPGLRPYLYDFVGDGAPNSPWTVTMIDSLSSEAPSGDPARPNGFADYPWQLYTDGTKLISDSRIQASRTADGNYIVYTFAESDTAVTTNGTKWNQLPNVKARLMTVATQSISPVEVNITKPATGSNQNVASRAYFHYASRKCAVAQTIPVGPNGPCIVLPITVSRNVALDPNTAVTHRYASAALNFGTLADGDMVLPLKAACVTETTTGISENSLNAVNSSFVYPNPAKTNAVVSLNLQNNSPVNVTVSNMVGQVVRTAATEGVAGENKVDINVSGLAKGIYMVTIKIDAASSTKKLIVE